MNDEVSHDALCTRWETRITWRLGWVGRGKRTVSDRTRTLCPERSLSSCCTKDPVWCQYCPWTGWFPKGLPDNFLQRRSNLHIIKFIHLLQSLVHLCKCMRHVITTHAVWEHFFHLSAHPHIPLHALSGSLLPKNTYLLSVNCSLETLHSLEMLKTFLSLRIKGIIGDLLCHQA
jgi:hypothetical protein